jgi:hypothetical protein
MVRVSGLIVVNELVCDGCGRIVKHPERYGYICEDEEEDPMRLCEECSRERGSLTHKKDDKGRERETFL